jgi:hypothetical protein
MIHMIRRIRDLARLRSCAVVTAIAEASQSSVHEGVGQAEGDSLGRWWAAATAVQTRRAQDKMLVRLS